MKRIGLFSQNVINVFETDDTIMSFNKLLVDTAKGDTVLYSKEEANAKIREKFNAVLGLDENATAKERRKAIRRHHIDIYEIIEETVENLLETGWGENPFFNQFVEIRNLASGDMNEFYVEDNSILSVSEVSGNHHSIIRQRLGAGESYRIKTSWYAVKIYAEYELFMAGRVDWAGFVQKIYAAFDNKLNGMVYSSLMAAGTKLPSNSQFNKTGNLTTSTKSDLITLVEDVETATGYEAVIMGTRTALSKLTALTDANWISEDMKKERNTTGVVGIWEGIKLVVIPQVFGDNDTTTKLVDNTKLLIMPLADNRFIKVVNEGEAQVKEISEGGTNADMTIEYEYQHKMGVSTVINMIFGIWTITG